MKLKFNAFAKSLMLLLFVAGMSNFALAQRTVTGTVTDADNGDPLIGANILVVGTSTGAVTDIDGTYSIRVPEGDQRLEFTYTGYATQTIEVGASNVIDVTMSPGEALEEVVVIGYGTQKSKEVTSSIVSVKEEDFNQGNISNPVQLLQGKVAGLTVARAGGNPNGNFSVRLRGLGTIGANTEPLIVIDGVPGGDLNSIDPNDVASIDVLKDGSAAAIYGTRGASGVILITTKRGGDGNSSVSYNGFVGFEGVDRAVDVFDAAGLRQFAADNPDLSFTDVSNGQISTDAFDAITRTGINHTHNLSLSGGSNGSSYRVSANYRDVEGIALNTGFDQLNARLNFSQKALNDRLTLSTQLTATSRNSDFGFDEAFRYATIWNPTAPLIGDDLPAGDLLRDEANRLYDGYLQQSLFDYQNPLAILEQNTNQGQRRVLGINLRGVYQLAEGLELGGFYSQQRTNFRQQQYYDKQAFFRGTNRNGLANQFSEEATSELVESTLRYETNFGGADVEFLGGYSYQDQGVSNFRVEGGDFLSDQLALNNLSAGLDFNNGRGSISSFRTERRLIAFFGRAQVNIDDTYFGSASLRYEGSSVFGENNQWGYFPAISAGVNIARLAEIPFDQLKVRAGYGVSGNTPGGDYIPRPRFGPSSTSFFFNGSYIPSYGPRSNPNPDLKWEVKSDVTVGVDFALMDYRLTGSLEYYNTETDDLILGVTVPSPPAIFPTTEVNVGQINNSGFELAIQYQAVQNDNFSWSPAFNFSTFDTELVSLSRGEFSFGNFLEIANLGAPGQNQTPLILVEEGAELGQIYGPVFEGIDDAGQVMFADLNGDGMFVEEDDRTIIGNGLPDFQLGFANTFTFGNWDANIFFRGVFGHDLVNTFRAFYEAPGAITSYNILASTADNVANQRSQAKFSSLHVESADFVKLDNASIGYRFDLPTGNAFRSVRAYVSGQNLFTITGYSGVDPEPRLFDTGDDGFQNNPLAPGIDRRNTYFRTRSVQIGVELGF